MAHFFVVVSGSKIHERVAHFFIDIYILKNLKILTRVHMRDLRVLYSLFYTFSICMLF